MIGYLNGTARPGGIVLTSGGVGYQVDTPAPLPDGAEVELWVHTAVRENDISLYGFTSPAERDLFTALTRVTGIGPGLALKILTLGAAQVASAVRDQDSAALAKAPGIGARKAQSLLAAVKVPEAVLAALAPTTQGVTPVSADPDADTVAALVNLGIEESVARSRVAALRASGITDEPALVRRSLRGAA